MWSHFMQAVRPVEQSQTLLLNEQSKLLEHHGKKIFKFGFGQSPFSPPQEVTEALRNAAHQHQYHPVQGLVSLRNAIAEFYRATESLNVMPDQIVITPGSKMSIFMIQAIFKEANVFIPSPAWVSYAPQARLLGHTVHTIPTCYEEGWRVTPAIVEATLSAHKCSSLPSVLILNYPGNPDGQTYTPQELEALATVLCKHQVLVISDEIYGLLHHEGKHLSLRHFYPEGTIITSGLAKWCGAGGWRLGITVLPDRFPEAMKKALIGYASETFSCVSAPVAHAAETAYHWTPTLADFVNAERKILQRIGGWCAAELQRAGIKVHRPMGGFYLMPDFSPFSHLLVQKNIVTSQDLCQHILADTGVTLLPSSAFGLPKTYLAARLAYVDFDGNHVIQHLAAFLEKTPAEAIKYYCPAIYEGITQLSNWCQSLDIPKGTTKKVAIHEEFS